MVRKAQPTPGEFSNAVVDALKDVMNNDDRTVLSLEKETGRSNNYLAKRFRKEADFTLTDIEVICEVLGLDLIKFLSELPPLPMSEVPDNVTPISQMSADDIDGIALKAALTDDEMDTDEN